MDESIQTPGEINGSSPSPTSEHSHSLNAESVSQYFREAESDPQDSAEVASATDSDTASGGDTPAETETPASEPAMVPSHRLREETEKRKELEERYNPWAAAIESLSAQGFTPAQIREVLTQAETQEAPPEPEPPAAEDPATDPTELEYEFERHLRQKGIDPYAVDQASLDLYRDNWETRRMVESQQARLQAEADQAKAQAAAAEWGSRWEADVLAIKANPTFSDVWQLQTTDGQTALIGEYINQHGQQPNRQQFQAFLDRNYVQPLQSLIHAKTQAFAAQKAQDNQVPSVAGGSSPPPEERVDFHSLKPSEQERRLAEAARHLSMAG